MRYAFFVSVARGETEHALTYTLSSLSQMGQVYVHFDTYDDYRVYRHIVDRYATMVAIATKRKGLAQGRSWAVEELPDISGADYVCNADSHITLLRAPICDSGVCDYQRCEYSFNDDTDPYRVIGKCVSHFGPMQWNFMYRTFVYTCDYKPYAYTPLMCVRKDVAKALRDLYGKYGLSIIPWEEYGSDNDQIYVSAFRLYGLRQCRCVWAEEGPMYLHRANNVEHPFWKSRWTPERIRKYAISKACFLKLHYPRELWGLVGNEPERCPIPDDVVKKINDEFSYGYAEFLVWFSKYVGQQDVELFRREVEVLGLRL